MLLILAGVTIAAISGDNGILRNAARAKNETEEAQKKEENILNSYEDQINEYAGIDWDTVLANAQKHPDQKTSTVIGVGTDGRAVNMDLWEYTKLDDETYAVSYSKDEKNIINGKIIGTIPQYIKGNDEFKMVTSLENCFIGNNSIKYPPKIPTTVTMLNGTFANCPNLEEPPIIPNSVEKIISCFSGCSSLKEMPEIPNSINEISAAFVNCTSIKEMKQLPDSIIIMASAFSGCTNLKNISNIPKYVQDMSAAFNSCTSLTNVNLAIPETVTNLQYTFQNCSNLTGSIKIDASVNGSLINNLVDYKNCFLDAATSETSLIEITGKCSVLNEIAEDGFNANIIVK